MKKSKQTIYVRYEFSDEAGQPEGGDILQFTTLDALHSFTDEVLGVSLGDKVTVNLTIGRDPSFFGFLQSVGINRQDAEAEMVKLVDDLPKAKAKKAKKKVAKKKTKKN